MPGPWAGPTPLQVPAALDEKVTVESQIRETEARKACETFESNRQDALRLTPIDDTERRAALTAAGKGDLTGLKKIAAGEGDWERFMGGSKSATSLLEQEQNVERTSGNADLARQVAQALKDALASGTMSVHVVNAAEIAPPPVTAPDPNRGGRMPAESQ